MRDREKSTWSVKPGKVEGDLPSFGAGLPGQTEVETDFSSRDLIAGLTALFRQCYGTDAANFRSVHTILRSQTEAVGGSRRDQRATMLDEWRAAELKLRQKSLESLLTERLARQRKLPFPTLEERALKKPPNPEQLINDYMSGDYMHRDRKADVVDERAKVPWLDAWHRQRYTEALIALSHIYIGFGVLAETAIS